MKGYVYILKDSVGKLYVGSTTNLERRLKQHREGHTQTTARMKDQTIVLSQEYPSLLIARRIEVRLKNLKRKDYLEKIIKDGFIKIEP